MIVAELVETRWLPWNGTNVSQSSDPDRDKCKVGQLVSLALEQVGPFSEMLQDAQSIGVCYGRVADNLPPPPAVASMYTQNDIGKMRMYDADPTVLSAFENSGVEIMVGVANQDIQTLASSEDAATQWFTTNIKPHLPAANIAYISVGDEILPADQVNAPLLLPAMQNLYAVIQTAGLENDIKVSTSHSMGILGSSYPPSAGAFSAQVADTIKSILGFLAVTDSPFMINVYPYFSYSSDPNDILIDYALFLPTSPVVDGNLTYHNLFDAMVDAVFSAMEVFGYPNVAIVVTESGWPSNGTNDATVSNAETYNNNFIQHVLSTAGTPKRPGQSIESFVFAMFDEDQKPGPITEQHFGLFYPDTKLPVYPVNFTLI
eukprot:PITA_16735